MKVSVDRAVCELHGQCVVVAPGVFEFDNHGDLQYQEEPQNELVAQATEAASFCPAQAIHIEG